MKIRKQCAEARAVIRNRFPDQIETVIFHRENDKKIHGVATGIVHWKNGHDFSFVNFDFDRKRMMSLTWFDKEQIRSLSW